jgi:hypothetical protein
VPRFFAADFQPAPALYDVKDLLGIVVDVQGRRFARLQHDHEGLGRFCLGAVHHQFVGMGGEAVADGVGGAKDVLG